jgi:hypothetical protein
MHTFAGWRELRNGVLRAVCQLEVETKLGAGIEAAGLHRHVGVADRVGRCSCTCSPIPCSPFHSGYSQWVRAGAGGLHQVGTVGAIAVVAQQHMLSLGDHAVPEAVEQRSVAVCTGCCCCLKGPWREQPSAVVCTCFVFRVSVYVCVCVSKGGWREALCACLKDFESKYTRMPNVRCSDYSPHTQPPIQGAHAAKASVLSTLFSHSGCPCMHSPVRPEGTCNLLLDSKVPSGVNLGLQKLPDCR